MVRNSLIQVRQNTDRGSINKTKRGQRTQLRYVAGHYSTHGCAMLQDITAHRTVALCCGTLQRTRLRYVAGHYSTSQQNKVDPRWLQMLANIFKCPIFLWNVVVFNHIWMQAIGLDRMQQGGTPVATCTVPVKNVVKIYPVIYNIYTQTSPSTSSQC